jgi:hypothetical protein
MPRNPNAPTPQCEADSFCRYANYEDALAALWIAFGAHDDEEGALLALDNQRLRDIWHGLVGKRMGLKNSTGLDSKRALVVAILGAYHDHREGDRRPHHVSAEGVTAEDQAKWDAIDAAARAKSRRAPDIGDWLAGRLTRGGAADAVA